MTTTHAVRAAIQRSQASLARLSRELGINLRTVAKWRKRATVEDLQVCSFLPIARAWGIRPPIGFLNVLPAPFLSGMIPGAIGLRLASAIRQMENTTAS